MLTRIERERRQGRQGGERQRQRHGEIERDRETEKDRDPVILIF